MSKDVFSEHLRSLSEEGLDLSRQAALKRFLDHGLPTTRMENWRYTSLAALSRQAFSTTMDSVESKPDLTGLKFSDGLQLVFINGHFSAQLSSLNDAAASIKICALSQLSENQRMTVLAEEDGLDADESLSYLNQALAIDGLYVHMPAGANLDQPVHCLYLNSNADQAQMSHVRNVIQLEAGARLEWIEHYHHIDSSTAHFTNVVNQVELAANAVLNQYRVQVFGDRESLVTRQNCEHSDGAVLNYYGFDLGGHLIRHDINPQLQGEKAAANLHGVYIGRGRRHIDNHLRIDHASPNTLSAEHYNGVMQDRSRAVFNGKVVVHEGADGTDASQSNHNLLMSRHAEVDTKPELEIYADDVQCSHGATVGQIDQQQLFYLKSRGISEDDARAMLVRAFCSGILSMVEDEALKVYLEQHINQQLPQAEV